MFAALGRLTYRRRRLVVLGWFVTLVVGMALSGTVMTQRKSNRDSGGRTEAAAVARQLQELAPTGDDVVAIVDGLRVDDPRSAEAIGKAAAAVRDIPHVVNVIDHPSTGIPALVSRDGQATLIVAQLEPDLDTEIVTDTGHAVAEVLRTVEGATVTVGGSALLHEEFQVAVEKDLQRGETMALPIALIALVFIFGGVVAAGMPLLVALASVAGAMFVLLAASSLTDMSVFSLNVVFMFGIGLGIDYGLLMISRFREERAAGRDTPDAVEQMVATAGRTVAFSALTVAVALCGLFAFEDPTFRSFAIAGIGVVLVSLAAAVTLLPAATAMCARRIKPATARTGDTGTFHRLATLVQRRAVPVVGLVSFVLVLLAAPFAGAKFENGDARYLPKSSESRAVVLALQERFPARGTDPIVVVANAPAADARISDLVRTITGWGGVEGATVRDGIPAALTVIDVVPSGTNQGDVAQRLVRQLRAHDAGVDVQVGGPAALLVDTKEATAERLPLAFGVIALATFVLLFLMTGSLAVPLKAILMNVLSLGASFGGLVWVFQDGHLSGLLGFEPLGAVDLFMPVLIFIFAFGLSMDYEVFLLARIKEAYDETGDNDVAVAVGLQRTGRIITSAAFLIVTVFAGFAMGEVLGIKQLGFGLALAVIVDATIVRSLLVPATMRLLGDWNWWAPRPLRRLHARFGISEGGHVPAPVVDQRVAA
jgi:putative drug exporter of the RND superfamily